VQKREFLRSPSRERWFLCFVFRSRFREKSLEEGWVKAENYALARGHKELLMQSQTIPSSLLVFLADSVSSSGWIPNEINFVRLNLPVALTLCAPATQTVRYWRMLRVSDTADDENRKTCWPIPVAGPMRHDGEVCSAQFSADGQRVVTASGIRRRESGMRR
jgi:hypothetical protein